MTPETIRKIVEMTVDSHKIFSGDAELLRKKLLFICHPDTGGTAEALIALERLWGEYEDSSTAQALLRIDDICSSVEMGLTPHSETKTVLNNDDGDLLENEAQTLDLLGEKLELLPDFGIYFPTLVTYDDYSEELTYPFDLEPSALVTLEEVKRFYGDALDIRHLGWIWRRLVTALGFAHSNGIVHGGILPNAILIGPKEHDVILTNWYNASYQQEALRVKSETYPQFYPTNLGPVIPELDIFMASKVMLWAFLQMPQELQFYFDRASMEAFSGVLSDPIVLIREFDRRIHGMLGWRKEFVELQWINYEMLREELLKS